MSWSKTNKGRKPLGWWYHKIMCEFAYYFKGSSSSMYYRHLLAMSAKYGRNLYGQKISEVRRQSGLYIGCENGIPDSPIGYALNVYLDGEKMGETKPIEIPKWWMDEYGNLCNNLNCARFDGEKASYTITFLDEPTLQEQLQSAIEIENYEEAARIRDKMNQTK